jgi:hypothetical protein
MTSSGFGVAAAATVIFLAGCSSGSTSPPAPVSGSISYQIAHQGFSGKPLSVIPEAMLPRGPWVRPAWWRDAHAGSNAKKTSPIKTIVVSLQEETDVLNYSQTGSEGQKMTGPFCSITGQAYVTDMGEDSRKDLYIPNGATDTVNIFAPDCGSQLGSYKVPYGQPVGIATELLTSKSVRRIKPADSIIERTQDAVFDLVGPSSSPGNVAMCTVKGCSEELTDPSISEVIGGAFDGGGNVWASYINRESLPALIVWPNGKMPGEVVSGYVNAGPGGLEFDSTGNLVAIDSSLPGAYSYTCSAESATCTSNGSAVLNGNMVFGKIFAEGTAFDVADYTYGSIDVYSYPGFTYQYSYIQGLKQSGLVLGLTGVPIQGLAK